VPVEGCDRRRWPGLERVVRDFQRSPSEQAPAKRHSALGRLTALTCRDASLARPWTANPGEKTSSSSCRRGLASRTPGRPSRMHGPRSWKRQLATSSRHSSKPPSTDGLEKSSAWAEKSSLPWVIGVRPDVRPRGSASFAVSASRQELCWYAQALCPAFATPYASSMVAAGFSARQDGERPSPDPRRNQARHRARLPRLLAAEPVGLGDVVKRVTGAVGVRPCSACEQRAARLNRWLEFGPRP
jgi:hypothetical protein